MWWIMTNVGLSQLGYFQPGHTETVCHVEGRNHPLARTALQHEVAHENLTSWSTSGFYSRVLSNVASALPENGNYPDPLLCLATIVESARETHEGFATFAQLVFILSRRFGYEAYVDSIHRLPDDYRSAAGKFILLWRELDPDEPLRDPYATHLAVRAFAIFALNVDIFQRLGRFYDQLHVDLRAYLAEPKNNPDARFNAVLQAILCGEERPLMRVLRRMLIDINSEIDLVDNPERREALLAAFSRRVNALVLKHFHRRKPVDLTILSVDNMKSAVIQFLDSAAQHYGISRERLQPRWRTPGDPVQQQHEKRHIIEFSDARHDFLNQPLRSLRSLANFLRGAREHGIPTMAALLSDGRRDDSMWMIDAAARHSFAKFSTGVVISRSAHSSLPEVLEFMHMLDTPVALLDVLLDSVSTSARETLLIKSQRLYMFCPMVSIASIQRTADMFIERPAVAVMLRDAIDHHALLLVRERTYRRSLVAVIAEDSVPRYEYFLQRTFEFTTRKADPIVDAEPLLAAWVYAYGPCADFLRTTLTGSWASRRPNSSQKPTRPGAGPAA
jgi:hypothetical protein